MILPLEPVHPFGLAVLGEHIYWTDWVKRSVIRADKYTGGDVTVMVSKLRQQPMGLVMVSEDVSECKWILPAFFYFSWLLAPVTNDVTNAASQFSFLCELYRDYFTQDSMLFRSRFHKSKNMKVWPE